jgi:hypothetical protein
MADRDFLQDPQTESEDQDLCGDLPKRSFDPDLDSIDQPFEPPPMIIMQEQLSLNWTA